MTLEHAHDQHRQKKAKIAAAKEKLYADKVIEKGLLIVHTGPGKGKSTAAWGMAMRCLGHGLKLGVVQFGKGSRNSGERALFARFPDLVRLVAVGEGFTWETQDKAADMAGAAEAFSAARAMLQDPSFHMVILDELNIALRYDYLPLEEVLATLKSRHPACHAVVTGRNAKPELIEMADLVTEMTLLKHPFRDGVKAQIGVEF